MGQVDTVLVFEGQGRARTIPGDPPIDLIAAGPRRRPDRHRAPPGRPGPVLPSGPERPCRACSGRAWVRSPRWSSPAALDLEDDALTLVRLRAELPAALLEPRDVDHGVAHPGGPPPTPRRRRGPRRCGSSARTVRPTASSSARPRRSRRSSPERLASGRPPTGAARRAPVPHAPHAAGGRRDGRDASPASTCATPTVPVLSPTGPRVVTDAATPGPCWSRRSCRRWRGRPRWPAPSIEWGDPLARVRPVGVALPLRVEERSEAGLGRGVSATRTSSLASTRLEIPTKLVVEPTTGARDDGRARGGGRDRGIGRDRRRGRHGPDPAGVGRGRPPPVVARAGGGPGRRHRAGGPHRLGCHQGDGRRRDRAVRSARPGRRLRRHAATTACSVDAVARAVACRPRRQRARRLPPAAGAPAGHGARSRRGRW